MENLKKKTAAEYIETVYGTRNFAIMLIADDANGVMKLMQNFSDHNVKASIPYLEPIRYKGRGEHSTSQLENIVEAYIELSYKLNRLKND